jgi:hypothetical protein
MFKASPPSLSARRLACTLLALGAVGAVAAPTLAHAASTPTPKGGGGTLGTFTFSKELSGSVTEPKTWSVGAFTAPTCQQTVDKGELNIDFYDVKLKLNGKTTLLTGGDSVLPAMLFVSAQKYGTKESVTDSSPGDGSYLASAGINLWVGHAEYSWITNAESKTVKSAGTVSMNANGTAGSLDVTMVPVGTGETSGLTTKATGLLSVKGSWSTCAKSKGA